MLPKSHLRFGRALSWSLLSGLVAASLVLAACGGGAAATNTPAPTEPPKPTFSGIATITFVQEPDSLNPFYTGMFFSQITQQFWLKPWWSFDDQGNPVPELVKEIPTVENGGVSADGKTITVHLRDDVAWSDGTPLTADDYAFTFDMVMSQKNIPLSRYPYEDYVASVVAQDKTTVVITLKEFFAAWMTSLFAGTTTVLPKHILQPVFDKDGTIDNAEWNRNPTVGLGPFVFKEWESGSHITFEANPNWIKPPKLEQIFIRIVPDDAAQEAAIIAGDSDIGVFLSSDQIDKLEAGGKVKVVTNLSGYNESWFLNVNPATAHPAMLDANVRKAIALATDRFTIVKNLLKESINPVNATYWDMTPPFGDPSIKPYPYDPDQAKQLLDAAGWTVGSDGIREKVIDGNTVKLKLRYITTTRELRKNVQAVVQQQWAQVGIDVELVNYSSDIFFGGYKDNGPAALGEYDVQEYSSAASSFPDPDNSSRWLCNQVISADNPDGINDQGYCNPQMDELLKKQATTPDRNERIQLYYQIEKLMYDEAIYVGIWKDPDLYSVNVRLQNVRFAGASPFWNAHEWTIAP